MPTPVILLLDLHFLCQVQNHLTLIPQFSDQCPTAEMAPNCAQHILCYFVNCPISCEWNKDCVLLHQILTLTKVQNGRFLLIFLGTGFIVIGRSCTAEVALLVTVGVSVETFMIRGLFFRGYRNTRWEYWKNCLHGNSLWILEAEKIKNKRCSQQKWLLHCQMV